MRNAQENASYRVLLIERMVKVLLFLITIYFTGCLSHPANLL